jgi:hypothetical protein
MLASWSRRVTTTSSPGVHCFARARARSYVAWVIDRAKTTPRGNLAWHLRAAGPVEERDALLEGREVAAEPLDVEVHDAILS